MAKKTYISLTGITYTFPVKINEKVHWISFSGDQIDYSTSNSQIQEALENHPNFTDGKIGIFSSSKKDDETEQPIEPKEYDAQDLNEAVSILKSVYKVHHSKLKSKEAVFAVAKELGVSFPNLPLD